MKVGRSLKSAQKSYSGPLIKIDDLSKPRKVKSLITLSQMIHHEKDNSTPCVNYPHKNFKTFEDCDMMKYLKDMDLSLFGLQKHQMKSPKKGINT